MKQYTIEELNTIGTEIEFPNVNLKYRCVDWNISERYDSHNFYNSRKDDIDYNCSIKGNIKIFNNEEHIVVDRNKNKYNFYMISLDELRKHNLIKEDNLENQEIEVGDTVEVISLQSNHKPLTVGTKFIVGSISKSAWDWNWLYLDEHKQSSAIAHTSVKLIKKANKNMYKEIIGYKLKDEFKHLEIAAAKIALGSEYTELANVTNEYNFTVGSYVAEKLEKAKVLNLWFSEVYKSSKEIVKLNSDSGTFELEVSKEGIYYAPERTWLNTSQLNQCVYPKQAYVTNSVKGEKDGSYSVVQHITHLNIGCKHQIPIADLQKVLTVYNTLKNG